MILITGIPNAGKTTYSSQFENVIHFDGVRGRDRRDKIVSAVEQDNSICVEGVYAKARERKRLVEASKAKNTCIWLNMPLDMCVYRENTGRQRSEHLVQVVYEDFEPPTYDEGWDEIIEIKEVPYVEGISDKRET